LRYIGHLDFLKVFQKTIRRAGLPAVYSQGFNPHMQLSFALPLPLGMTSFFDYADITLEQEMPGDEIVSLLNAHAPEGLILCRAWEFTGPGAAALATAADYIFNYSDEKSINAILGQGSIVIPKKTKSGIKDTDVRPDIFDISLTNGNTIMRLAAGSGRFLNPLIVAKLITGNEISPASIIRHDLYTQDENKGLISLNETPVF